MSAVFRRALFLLTFILTLPLVAHAGPKDFIEGRQRELAGLLKQGGAENERKISAVFDEMLDYRALAERSLGSEWAKRTDAERGEFTTVLEGLVKSAYRKNLGKTVDYDVAVNGESQIDGGTLVRTVATHRSNKREAPISIDYGLHKVGNDWKIFDIVTEGSSLAKNYRNQFTRVIRKKGFAELLSRMRKKLNGS